MPFRRREVSRRRPAEASPIVTTREHPQWHEGASFGHWRLIRARPGSPRARRTVGGRTGRTAARGAVHRAQSRTSILSKGTSQKSLGIRRGIAKQRHISSRFSTGSMPESRAILVMCPGEKPEAGIANRTQKKCRNTDSTLRKRRDRVVAIPREIPGKNTG